MFYNYLTESFCSSTIEIHLLSADFSMWAGSSSSEDGIFMNDRIGQQLGSYRLTHLLGRGGFADVYLGEHTYLKTPAAIKVLQASVTSNDDLDGFLREAQNIAHLVHPHIVRVLDFGVDGNTPFLVMDYAPNGTLRQRHPKGTQLPLTAIVPYVKQVADALPGCQALSRCC